MRFALITLDALRKSEEQCQLTMGMKNAEVIQVFQRNRDVEQVFEMVILPIEAEK